MSDAVSMQGIVKKFPGGVIANNYINFEVKSCEIHGLLGENGAGKTTLMNILYGLYERDEGTIKIKGKEVNFNSPNEAVKAGIGMVHQHFMLIPTLTAAENIVLGAEPGKLGTLDYNSVVIKAKNLSERFGLKINPSLQVSELPVGIKQRIEILKALYRESNIIILDEPTAVLTPQEAEELLEILGSLKDNGFTIIFITHKLEEAKRFCDRITVIRDGENVDCVKAEETTKEELANKMVGRNINLRVEKGFAKKGEKILEVKNLCYKQENDQQNLSNINLSIKKGEILGVAGVDGNGQSELVKNIAGLAQPDSGEIFFKEQDISIGTPTDLYHAGISHIPEDRLKFGLIEDFSLTENLLLNYIDNNSYKINRIFVDYKKAKNKAEQLIKEYSIKANNPEELAGNLSGGNQQKLIIARELERDPELLIAAQPTRGLDVGAIEFVHNKLLEARENGKAILLISMDLDEIMQLSDRIKVMYEGQFIGEYLSSEATKEKIGLLMGGYCNNGQ